MGITLNKEQQKFVKQQNSKLPPPINPYHLIYNKDFYKSQVPKANAGGYMKQVRTIW